MVANGRVLKVGGLLSIIIVMAKKFPVCSKIFPRLNSFVLVTNKKIHLNSLVLVLIIILLLLTDFTGGSSVSHVEYAFISPKDIKFFHASG